MLGRTLACALILATAGSAYAGSRLVAVDPFVNDNLAANRTRVYRDPGRLVLRRAAAASVVVDVTPAFDPTREVVEFVFQNVFDDGDTIVEQRVPFGPTPTKPIDAWRTTLASEVRRPDGSRRRVMRIDIPGTAAVGEYTVRVVVRRLGDGAEIDALALPQPVLVLFHPWSSRDAVFLASEDERREYVLSDIGTMYSGSAGAVGEIPWSFGQFDRRAVDVALSLLDGLDTTGRRSPAAVARHLAARVNAEDFDAGLLGGSWDSQQYGRCYRGKTSATTCSAHATCDTAPGAGNGRCAFAPWKWVSSGELFDQFLSRGPEVRWAQCWVFAGTFTALLRGLGIPSRPVTGYMAGVDKGGNGIIDFYLAADGQVDYVRSVDRWWNFHVWVEAWMRRPDLPRGADGWQALDATPQVQSGGVYRLGPAPVAAVRAGGGPGVDVPFVRAQVDGDVRYWITKGPSDALVSTDTTLIGRDISTKAPGKRDRLDVTGTYKAVALAATAGLVPARIAAGSDVRFTLDKTTTVAAGDPIGWSLTLENTASAARSVNASFHANAVSYDGTPLALDVAVAAPTVALAPGETRTVGLTVPEAAYRPFLDRTRTLQVVTRATVLETEDEFADVDQAGIAIPGLDVTVSPDVPAGIGEQRQLSVSFTNPFDVPLDGVVLRYRIDAGATIDGTDHLELALPPLDPGEGRTDTRTVVALEPGSHLISVALDATQLTGVRGGATVTATAPPPASLCGPTPAGGCRVTGRGASALSIRLGSDPTKNRLTWKWAKGGETGADELSDPVAGNPLVRLCLYDESAVAQPLRELDVPTGGLCGTAPCWKRAKSGTLSYRDPLGASGGVTRVVLKPGADGKAQVTLEARGPSLDLPALPLTAPVTVQLLVSSGETTTCWQTTYQEPARNRDDALRARGPE